MTPEEIIAKDIEQEIQSLEPHKQASLEYSLPWKSLSKRLLSTNDIGEFKEAVRWCGIGGNVSRTVYSGSFDAFVDYVFDMKSRIDEGVFQIIRDEIIPELQRGYGCSGKLGI